MAARLRSSEILVTGGALALIGVAATHRVGDLTTFIAFVLLIAISELFEVRLSNDDSATLGLAPALGFVLLGGRTLEVVAAFGAGALIAVGLRMLTRRPVRTFELASHALALGMAWGIYESVRVVDPLPPFASQTTSLSPIGLAATFVVVLGVQGILFGLRAAEKERIPFLPLFRGQISSTAMLQLSVVSVGALLALAYPTLREYAFALFLFPLAATHFAFRQFSEIRKTYLQTIRALSKVPEMAGYTRPGHSSRVAELSVAIARELGVRETDVREIEYAALLHDIGRVSIPDPDEPHAIEPPELAHVGATIVRETGHFPKVAEMIARQQDPYRSRGVDSDPSLHSGAKIIKVASAYDDLTNPGPVGLNPWDALERLHLGMAYDYDPAVIQALTRVLEKRGAL